MVVAVIDGVALTYDTEDVEVINVSTPSDIVDVTKPEDTGVRRAVRGSHLRLSVDFKPGKRPVWIKEEELNHG